MSQRVDVAQGNAEDAARLLGAADRLFREMEYTFSISEQAPVQEGRNRVRAVLGEEQFSATWEAGRALERDTAVTEALALVNAAREATST